MTLKSEVDLEATDCCVCGVVFALPKHMLDNRRDDHSQFFWCPFGHRLHFTGETPSEKASRLEQRNRELRENLELERTRVENAAEKLRKLKKRLKTKRR